MTDVTIPGNGQSPIPLVSLPLGSDAASPVLYNSIPNTSVPSQDIEELELLDEDDLDDELLLELEFKVTSSTTHTLVQSRLSHALERIICLTSVVPLTSV